MGAGKPVPCELTPVRDTGGQSDESVKVDAPETDSVGQAGNHAPGDLPGPVPPIRTPGSMRRAQMLIALAVMLAGDNIPPLSGDESEPGHE